MMRRAVLIAAAATLLCTPDAHAGFLVGASVGQAGVEIDDSSSDFDEDDTGFSARVGYRFLKFFGVEAGYVDFGKPEGDVGNNVNLEADATGFDIYAVGIIPITRLEIFGKVGYFQWDFDTDISSGSSPSGDGNDLSYGVGIGLHVVGPFHVRAEYEVFQVDVDDVEDSELSMVSIGADFRF